MSNKDWKKFKEAHKDDDLDDLKDFDTALEEEPALEYPSHEDLEERLTLSEQEAFKLRETVLRLQAEVENVRTRANKEVTKAHLYGAEQLVKSLLPVIDSLEQAIQLASKGEDWSMREGLELTLKLFLDALQKQGVSILEPTGAPFDPHEHEAMSMQEQKDVAPNTVLVVFQKGYKLNDRVIRPARVIVSKGQSSA